MSDIGTLDITYASADMSTDQELDIDTTTTSITDVVDIQSTGVASADSPELVDVMITGRLEDLTDDELVGKIKAEPTNSRFFSELTKRHKSNIYGKALSMLEDKHDADDAVQEILVKIFLSLDKFSGDSKFSTWVYSITYNCCVDFIRKRKRRRNIFVAGSAEGAVNDQEVENLLVQKDHIILSDFDDSEEEQKNAPFIILRKVLNKLNEGDRDILLWKYKDGIKIKDIAKQLGKNESAVKMQLKRAKEKAKRKIEELRGEE